MTPSPMPGALVLRAESEVRMRYRRNPLKAVLMAALAGAFVLSLGVGSASSQTAPTEIQRAIALTNPAVVIIESRANVSVFLSDPVYDKEGRLRLTDIPAGAGSGFFINDSGGLVTARHVIRPDRATVRSIAARAIFAPDRARANRLARTAPTSATILRSQIASAQRQCLRRITCRFDIDIGATEERRLVARAVNDAHEHDPARLRAVEEHMAADGK